MTPTDPAIARLAPLSGTWRMTADFPQLGREGVTGQAELAFDLGGAVLVERSTVDLPEAPDALAVIAADPAHGGYRQHYFDTRGVVRLYAMTFDGTTWTLQRDTADFSALPFRQRFTGTLSADGTAIDGRWEKAAEGGAWELDFPLRYTRL